MAKTGQMIENPVTGQRILFLTAANENGGTRWEVEWFVKPHQGQFPPEHFHPTFSEQFEILSGTSRYRVDGREYSANSGDVVNIAMGSPHLNPWNAGDEELNMRHIIQLAQPNLKMLSAAEDFYESLCALARDGKVSKDGLPNLLQFAVLAESTSPLAYPPGIPMGTTDILFGVLARLGRLLGYSVRYPKFSEIK